ncbi:MAG: cell division protein FtsZ [Pseudomonadota bacterium]|nr:cell division protein FtsZ [Pseudomonadota bacterium]
MTINLSVPVTHDLKPRLTVMGVGGAGCNAVNNMITAHLEGVDFVVANTDAQALTNSLTERRIQLGASLTQGLGAGMKPEVGRDAAEEVSDIIFDYLDGAHMLFVTAGMGGGTGTGAAPVIARIAREQGILTVGVVTKPFQFEGKKRMTLAEAGITELQECVDTLIMIPNQNLFRIANENTTMADAFKLADDVLYSGVRGVTDLMVMPGLINLDFADVRSVMNEMGKAMMGTGEAEGERRAIEAAEHAVNNPLLDDVSLMGARGVLINITGGPDMTLYEVDEACNHIRGQVDDEANIIFGSTFDEELAGRVRISVVATGIGAEAGDTARPDVTRLPIKLEEPRRSAGSAASGGDVSSGIVGEQPPVTAAGAQYGFRQVTKSYEQPGPKVAMPDVEQTAALESKTGEDDFTLFNAPTSENQESPAAVGNQLPNSNSPDRKSYPVRSSEENSTIDKTSIFGRAKRVLTRTGGLEADHATMVSKGVAVLETVDSGPSPILAGEPNKEEDALEIPAFLRRQSR